MSIPTVSLRSTYRRSGQVSWPRFVPYVLLTFLVSLVMAVCLCLAFERGWYYFLITPAIASLPAAGVAYLAVGGGHCRSRIVAGVFGILAAALLYLGYFHVHFVSIVRPIAGPAAIYRVDCLPGFISFRMRTDVVVDERGKERQEGVFMNWLKFGLEFFIVIGLAAAAAVTRSGRVYCERCRCWARRLAAHLPPGTARIVERALRPGCLETLPEVAAIEGQPKSPFAQITLEYCRRSTGPDAACPVYLTAKEVVDKENLKGQSGGKILDQVEITPEEFQALAGKIAPLGAVGMKARPPGAVPAPTEPGAVEWPASPYVESLPAEWGNEVFSKRNKVLAISLSLMPVVLAVAGVVMIGFGLWRQPWAVGPGEGVPVVPWLLVGVGLLAAGFGVVVCWKNVDFFNFRLGYRVTRAAIQFRSSAVVDPDDPDALYVEIVPREHWSGLIPDLTSDAGFLKVDTRSRELLFEGARERYRIPGEALASCQLEPINPQAGRFGIYVAVIRTRDPEALADAETGEPGLWQWEAPLLPRPVRFGRYGGAQRRRLADGLRDRIRAIMPPDTQTG